MTIIISSGEAIFIRKDVYNHWIIKFFFFDPLNRMVIQVQFIGSKMLIYTFLFPGMFHTGINGTRIIKTAAFIRKIKLIAVSEWLPEHNHIRHKDMV